jgi:hypothetical protein
VRTAPGPYSARFGAGEPLRDVPTLVPRVLLFVKQVCVLVEEGLTLAGVRRVFELEAQVAALEAELARERARLTDRRS